jgi:putative ATPase
MDEVREGRTIPVPKYLMDQTKRRLSRHEDDGSPLAADREQYRSPHAEADGLGRQEYLGVDRTFYRPTDRGHEATIRERLERAKSRRKDSREGGDRDG